MDKNRAAQILGELIEFYIDGHKNEEEEDNDVIKDMSEFEDYMDRMLVDYTPL